MKLNKHLIEKLANGEIAVDNSERNLELLRAVLTEAFPKDNSSLQGYEKYYLRDRNFKTQWGCYYKHNLPTIPLLDFLEKEGEFILPARWCVRQNKQEINDWANQNRQTESNYIDLSGVHLFHFPKVNNFHLYSEVQPGYTLLTFEQFKKHILKQTEMKKEIIGYKAPCNLYGYVVEKGTIYVKCINKDFYEPKDLVNKDCIILPKEIVEQWEAVYKEEFQVGDYVITEGYSNNYDGRILKISKITSNNCCYFDIIDGGSYKKNHNFLISSILRKATPEEIEKAKKIVVKMHSSNKGEFEIEVINKKAYYRPENKEFTKGYIERILELFKTNCSLTHPYIINIDSVKIGCMEGVKKEDIQKVYDLIK